MLTAAELAGFIAAHAVWSISDGDTLIPMLAYIDDKDQRKLDRLVHQELRDAVEHGRAQLASNAMNAGDAVLAYEGYVSFDDVETDALILEIRAYFLPDAELVVGIPFTPKASGTFLVHRPKILAWGGCDDFDLNQVVESFFAGVSSHEEGSKIWEAALDESR